jgi:hypothetical protein
MRVSSPLWALAMGTAQTSSITAHSAESRRFFMEVAPSQWNSTHCSMRGQGLQAAKAVGKGGNTAVDSGGKSWYDEADQSLSILNSKGVT